MAKSEPGSERHLIDNPGTVTGELREHSPADVDRTDHALVQKKVDRRSFIRVATLATTGTVAFVSSCYNAGRLIKGLWEFDHDSDDRLMLRLFGPGDNASAALIPAGNHTWMKPPQGTYWYALDASCADSYRERFLRTATFRNVAGFPNAAPEDSLGLFGSQTSNLSTRRLLGNPFEKKLHLDVAQPTLAHSQWSTRIHWNLHAHADLGTTERQQFGVRWIEPNYHIVSEGGRIFQPRAGVDWAEDDYLLVTVMPRYAKGPQRILVFAGCHGEGSLASAKIFADPPLRELRKLDKRIHGEPWYQALFHVTVQKTSEGEFRPGAVELVDAAPLLMRFHRA